VFRDGVVDCTDHVVFCDHATQAGGRRSMVSLDHKLRESLLVGTKRLERVDDFFLLSWACVPPSGCPMEDHGDITGEQSLNFPREREGLV
jgi:hypothetical protein